MLMRTNIDIDDALLAEAMQIAGSTTKRAAVEGGLRLLIQLGRQKAAIAALEGIGWDGDLDQIRLGRPADEE
jgi:Arc/MetJ family transcription regulator